MRVYIGPYTSRWISRVHERHMNIKYGSNDWDASKDWEDRAWEKLESGLQSLYNSTINRYIDKKERKIVIKLDRYDTWGMDHTLAHIIVPMLKQLKATKHGSPNTDDEDVPEHLRSTAAPPVEKWHEDDNIHARWEWILNEMIWAFEQKTRDWWEEDYIIEHGEIDWDAKPDDNGNTELKWKNEGKYDREGMKAHQERMSNGFRLFGKYYEALWD